MSATLTNKSKLVVQVFNGPLSGRKEFTVIGDGLT